MRPSALFRAISAVASSSVLLMAACAPQTPTYVTVPVFVPVPMTGTSTPEHAPYAAAPQPTAPLAGADQNAQSKEVDPVQQPQPPAAPESLSPSPKAVGENALGGIVANLVTGVVKFGKKAFESLKAIGPRAGASVAAEDAVVVAAEGISAAEVAGMVVAIVTVGGVAYYVLKPAQ